ncbi:phosphodiesterase [Pseudooceanicola batsensis HTCC2597]|uniref:Phosphodiesterase n=1 Tax=Pseudooceanicola batsensis (strain ATCC BAA-863 / DSM 15984 / KCTC 12145 / HTCC2597) TaxID=252305 RepID=A3TY95_PSEBH|nr:metallophosphoesterase [Pseudooceanicola batsensis]EAQ03129.1 phosphodiesterase [Pseudooceanicola batsensis HTCC2597]
MKLIHLSDIHLTVPGERMGGLDPHRRFAQALEHVNAHHSDADRIVITGDLTHWGERAAYEVLQNVLTEQAVPVRLLIGNHDDRERFKSVFTDHPCDANGYVNHAETLDDTRLIYLDSCAPKTHAGHFGADRLAWLEAELAAADHARIFMHHGPMEVGVPAKDLITMVAQDRPGLKSLFERYSTVIDYIHFGHVHAPIHGSYCGIPFSSVPSLGNQSIPDFAEPRMLLGGPLPPAYYVVQVDGRATRIHQVPFLWDGPVFATGTAWEDWAKPLAAE